MKKGSFREFYSARFILHSFSGSFEQYIFSRGQLHVYVYPFFEYVYVHLCMRVGWKKCDISWLQFTSEVVFLGKFSDEISLGTVFQRVIFWGAIFLEYLRYRSSCIYYKTIQPLMRKHYSHGKMLTLILAKTDCLPIWNAVVRYVDNNSISIKQCLCFEITKSFIYTIYNGRCPEVLLHTIILSDSRFWIWKTWLFFSIFSFFYGAERPWKRRESLYWEVYIGREFILGFSQNMLQILNLFKYFNQ